MANVTQQMASFYNNTIVFSATYNDANGRIANVSCVNNHASLTAVATVSNRVGASFTFSWAPQSSGSNNVPAGFGTVINNPDTGETILAIDGTFGVQV